MEKRAVSGDIPVVVNPPRQRFSLISYFTNNRNSKRNKKSKSRTKGKDAESIGTSTSSKYSQSSGQKSLQESQPAAPVHQARLLSDGKGPQECPLCFDELPLAEFPELLINCNHKSCSSCLEQYLRIEVSESRVDITCPECSERLHPTDIHRLLNSDNHISKYEEFMLRRVLVNDPDTRWCPAPDCGYAVIARGCAGCPMLRCERAGCNTRFCYHCKQEWHANQTCDAARMERLPILRLSLSDSSQHAVEEYKPCPRCKTIINKMDDGSCNHMTCSMCNAQFCWLCLKEASDLHYLSPSGCTFWGKKPWSKKKKILWQLGTLIGAPVGIALIAGISVPLIIIGLPIMAGRKLYRRFKLSNRHRRNVAVTFGTFAAFVVSPVISALTIAIGVPILLAYVYGVVPISLCRGGTCGVKNDNGMLSFDFGHSSGDGDSGKTQGGSVKAINPSIGPSIGEASMVTDYGLSASGVQMDRVGLQDDQSDRQSASIRNLAGLSVTGSIYEPEQSHLKLEVHADVNADGGAACRRKNSLGSVRTLSNADSHSLGPDNRSVRSFLQDNRSHVSFSVDNASVKALAGSISAPRDKDGISVVYSMDSNSDVKSKSCIKVEHGSPVSNRSVSFAAAPNDTPVQRKTKKHMKIRDTKVRDSERLDRLSQKSCDSSSSSTSTDNIPTSCKTVDSRHKPSGAGDAVHYIDISPCGSDSVKDSDVEGAVVNSAAATPVTSVNSDFAVLTRDTSASLEYIQEG